MSKPKKPTNSPKQNATEQGQTTHTNNQAGKKNADTAILVNVMDKRNKVEKLFDGIVGLTGGVGTLGGAVSSVISLYRAYRAEQERQKGLIDETQAKAATHNIRTGEFTFLRDKAEKHQVGSDDMEQGLRSAAAAFEEAKVGQSRLYEILKQNGIDSTRDFRGKNTAQILELISAKMPDMNVQDKLEVGDSLFGEDSQYYRGFLEEIGKQMTRSIKEGLGPVSAMTGAVNKDVQRRNNDRKKDNLETSVKNTEEEQEGIEDTKEEVRDDLSEIFKHGSIEEKVQAFRTAVPEDLLWLDKELKIDAKKGILTADQRKGFEENKNTDVLREGLVLDVQIDKLQNTINTSEKGLKDKSKRRHHSKYEKYLEEARPELAQLKYEKEKWLAEVAAQKEAPAKSQPVDQNNTVASSPQPASQHSTAQNAGQGQQGAPVSTGSVATGSVPTGTVMAPLEDSVKKDIADIKEAAQSIDQSIDDKTSELASLESDKGDKAEKDQSKDVLKEEAPKAQGLNSNPDGTPKVNPEGGGIDPAVLELLGVTQQQLEQMHREAVAAVMNALKENNEFGGIGSEGKDGDAAKSDSVETGKSVGAGISEGINQGLNEANLNGGLGNSTDKDGAGNEEGEDPGKKSFSTGISWLDSMLGIGKKDEEADPKKQAAKQTKEAMAAVLMETKIGNKLLAAEEKRKAIETAITAMHDNISQAMKAGFPLNVVLMAKAAMQGRKHIQAIKGQFHDGVTDVPSTGSYVLEKGERVVPKGLNQDLKGFMASARGRGALGAMGNMSELGRSTLKSAMGLVEDPSALGAARMERSGMSTAKMEGQLNDVKGQMKKLISTVRDNGMNGAKTFKNDIQINVAGPMTPENQYEVRQQLKDALNDLYLDHNLVSPFDRDE